VLLRHPGDHLPQRLHRLPTLLLAPGLEKELAQLIPIPTKQIGAIYLESEQIFSG
jgi:hypothetical protein